MTRTMESIKLFPNDSYWYSPIHSLVLRVNARHSYDDQVVFDCQDSKGQWVNYCKELASDAFPLLRKPFQDELATIK